MPSESEVHLFILWERARYKTNEIIQDINNKFYILNVFDIHWDEDNFSGNMTRFYGQKLPAGSGKELESGKGRFILVVVRDDSCIYSRRKTSSGTELVNEKMFDAKTLYRKWTCGGHKIHATNNPEEARHDLLLLLDKPYESFMHSQTAHKKTLNDIKKIDKNLFGCIQWSSMEQLFSVLNQLVNYVVLRNFDGLPKKYYSEEHGDIDLLVDSSPTEVAYLMNATPVYRQKYRVHYKVNINGRSVRFDIRYIGDEYYDEKWEKSIINTRVMNNGFYIPDDESYRYSLLYHAIIHKSIIADDYNSILTDKGFSPKNYSPSLFAYLEKNNYRITEPKDLSVYFNSDAAKQKISTKRKIAYLKDSVINFLALNLDPRAKRKIKNVIAKCL